MQNSKKKKNIFLTEKGIKRSKTTAQVEDPSRETTKRVKQTVNRERAKLFRPGIVPARPSTHAPRIPPLRVCV